MAAANLDLLECQFSDGCGQVHRDGAEADERGHGPEARSSSAVPQVGQGRQSSASGAVQGPQTGASAVPEWMPRSRPQAVQ